MPSKTNIEGQVRHLLTSGKLGKLFSVRFGRDAMRKLGTEIVNHAKTISVVDTGTLRDKWKKSVKRLGRGWQLQIRNDAKGRKGQYYSAYVEHGTGIYGPSGQMIDPPAGGFKWKTATSRQKKMAIAASAIGRNFKGGAKRGSYIIWNKPLKGQRPKNMLAEAVQTVLVNRLGGIWREEVRSL